MGLTTEQGGMVRDYSHVWMYISGVGYLFILAGVSILDQGHQPQTVPLNDTPGLNHSTES